MADRAKVEHWKRRLRAEFPSRIQVRVVWVPTGHLLAAGERLYGQTIFDDASQKLTLQLEDGPDEGIVLETLLHEWGHCLRFHVPYGEHGSDHDEIFAAIYGRIYRAFMG
jgi:hypothetical protein